MNETENIIDMTVSKEFVNIKNSYYSDQEELVSINNIILYININLKKFGYL
jgi:hypothetical protein